MHCDLYSLVEPMTLIKDYDCCQSLQCPAMPVYGILPQSEANASLKKRLKIKRYKK